MKRRRILFLVALVTIVIVCLLVRYPGRTIGRQGRMGGTGTPSSPKPAETGESSPKSAQTASADHGSMNLDYLLEDESVVQTGDFLELGKAPEIGDVITLPQEVRPLVSLLSPDGRYAVFKYGYPIGEEQVKRDVLLWDVSTGENRVLYSENDESGMIEEMVWLQSGKQMALTRFYFGPDTAAGAAWKFGVLDVDSGECRIIGDCPLSRPQIIGAGEDWFLVVSAEMYMKQREIYKVSLADGTINSMGFFPTPERDGKGIYQYYSSFRLRPGSREIHFLRVREGGGVHLMKASLDDLSGDPIVYRDLSGIGRPNGEVCWNNDGSNMAFPVGEILYVCDGEGLVLKHFEIGTDNIRVTSFSGDNILFTAPPRSPRVLIGTRGWWSPTSSPYIFSLKE